MIFCDCEFTPMIPGKYFSFFWTVIWAHACCCCEIRKHEHVSVYCSFMSVIFSIIVL
jgi:hypothetical protein